jgi:hypothetical protein
MSLTARIRLKAQVSMTAGNKQNVRWSAARAFPLDTHNCLTCVPMFPNNCISPAGQTGVLDGTMDMHTDELLFEALSRRSAVASMQMNLGAI